MWDSLNSASTVNDLRLIHVDDEDFCRVRLNRENNAKYNNNSDYINVSIVRSVLPVRIKGKGLNHCPLSRNSQTNHPHDSSMLRKVRGVTVRETSCWSASLFWGPTENTLDDFLRMIVEQEIDIIVMLSSPYDPITRTYIVSCTQLLSFIDSIAFSTSMHLTSRKRANRHLKRRFSKWAQQASVHRTVTRVDAYTFNPK